MKTVIFSTRELHEGFFPYFFPSHHFWGLQNMFSIFFFFRFFTLVAGLLISAPRTASSLPQTVVGHLPGFFNAFV